MGYALQVKQIMHEENRKVFVSSTYSDLVNVRSEVTQALFNVGCYPVGLELHAASTEKQWEVIRRVISESAYFLLIIGERYGADFKVGGKRVSFTEMEYDYATSIGKPILAFFYKNPEHYPAENVESNESERHTADRRKLDRFKIRVADKHLVGYWTNASDLIDAIYRYIPVLIQDYKQEVTVDTAEKKAERKFVEAATAIEVIEALETRAANKHNTVGGATKYACHYTKMSAVSAILRSKKWYFGSPKSMNDGLELIHLEDAHADNLFFASFSLDEAENIGMWSMYAQPWEDGVLLRIPVEKLKAWVNSQCKIYDADKSTKKAGEEINGAKFSFHAVAYTNAESKDPKEPDLLTCGEDVNTYFKDIFEHPLLKGYIKDSAWAYEKEYRIRVETDPSEQHDAVAVDIPKDVLESIEFITGPRFTRNFTAVLRNEAGARLKPIVKESLFTGRLKWVYCDSCGIRKQLSIHEQE